MYKDNKSGGSIITERLHMDVKQDFFFKKIKNVVFETAYSLEASEIDKDPSATS